MYFLDGCAAGLKPLFGLVNLVINAIMIGVPIVLIVLGMIDLGKAVIASKEDEVKKATKAFGKRFLYAVGVFAVVWLVTFVFDTVSQATDSEIDPNQANWRACWNEIRSSKYKIKSKKKLKNDLFFYISML